MSDVVNKGAAAAQQLYATQLGFAPVEAADEFLHGDDPTADYTLSETSYLGFNVPSAAISCLVYHWFHPRFDLASGGVMIFQGTKQRTGEGEYVDYRNFMPMPADIGHVRYDTGVEVRVIEPLGALRMTFAAPDGRASFDVTLTAVMPPAGRADGRHFAQTMRTKGILTLHGVEHRVDGYFVRDRSYLSPRAEMSHPIPPQGWSVAAFDEDLAMHFIGADGHELTEENLRWGYVWRDGRIRSLVKMRQNTRRASDGVVPTTVEVELEDSDGDRYMLQGRVIAMLPMNFWPNMVTHLALCEWRCGDRIGYGDLQDISFGQWLHEAANNRNASRL